jgi:RNA binding activity-knot of a chromodomain
VIEVKKLSSGVVEYLVHYAGWNNRYDEWIRRDSIVSVIEEPTDTPVGNAVVSTPVAPKSRQLSMVGSIISQVNENPMLLARCFKMDAYYL